MHPLFDQIVEALRPKGLLWYKEDVRDNSEQAEIFGPKWVDYFGIKYEPEFDDWIPASNDYTNEEMKIFRLNADIFEFEDFL